MENTTTTYTVETLTDLIIKAATKDDVLDCDFVRDVIKAVQAKRKEAKDASEAAKKAVSAEEMERNKELGKQYFDSLAEGDIITWMANGEEQHGTVGEQKEGAKTAHCILDEIPEGAKSTKADRYVKWEKICVPEEFAKSLEEVA